MLKRVRERISCAPVLSMDSPTRMISSCIYRVRAWFLVTDFRERLRASLEQGAFTLRAKEARRQETASHGRPESKETTAACALVL